MNLIKPDCTDCKVNCCKTAGNVGFGNVGAFCAALEFGLCTVYEKRPVLCEAYPFALASGELVVDSQCPQTEKLLDGLDLSGLSKIKTWLLKNTSKELIAMWKKNLLNNKNWITVET